MQIHEKKFIIRIDILTRGFFFFIERNVTFIFLPLFISSSIRDDDFHSRKVTFNLSSSSLLTNFPRFSTTVGNYRSRRFTLAAVSLTSIRVHGRQCFRNTRRRVPLPPMRASSLLVSSIYRSPS